MAKASAKSLEEKTAKKRKDSGKKTPAEAQDPINQSNQLERPSNSEATSKVNSSMAEHGVSIDLNNLKKEDIEVLIQSLVEMEINVDSKNGDKVRVFCT